MKTSFKLLAMATAIGLLMGCDGGPETFDLTETSRIDAITIKEPSGIVFHATRGTLFVVGDKGDVGEYALDGTEIARRKVIDASFEGITLNATSGLLYVVVEGADQIIEIETESLRALRTISIDRSLNGVDVLIDGGNGLEGITYQGSGSDGDVFYVTNQGDDNEDAFLAEVKVNLGGGAAAAGLITRTVDVGMDDLSGIFYDAQSGNLLIISDSNNRIREVTTSGEVVSAARLPGSNQEGVALDTSGNLYIAQDSGGIVIAEWTR